MAWTPKQQQVIDERDCNILVSAAAGSGKTATMLERVFVRVTDYKKPLDIDKFLMVTFTRAAASQMKDKLMSKFESALEKEPFNEHLARQIVLLQKADITTIDSFCLKLVKENFGLLKIDSEFAIGDLGMLNLMKQEVMDELFEKKRSEGNEDFKKVNNIFGNDKNDDTLKETIDKIYTKASSFPEEATWYANARKIYEINSNEEIYKTTWFKAIFKKSVSEIKSAIELAKKAYWYCVENGVEWNIELVNADIETLESLDMEDACNFLHGLAQIKFPNIKRAPKEFAYLQEGFKPYRNGYKDAVNLVVTRMSGFVGTKALDEIKKLSDYVIPLIDLVEEFSEEFFKAKTEKKTLGFSDVEHLAYQLVCEGFDEDGKVIPTTLGKEIAENYEEIYIDEYQDSNFLQEYILCAVSKEYRKVHNMFMVGDVKQSIYRFRMSRPELFMDKYNRYKDTGDDIKILLSNNFRSRDVVLNPVNFFFYQLMGEDFGGIVYDDDVALLPTKEFPKPDASIKARVSKEAEILLIDNTLEDESNIDEDYSKLEYEAQLIANRIKELVDEKTGMVCYDEDLDTYRNVTYKDIVILSRSVSGVASVFSDILEANGIPTYVEDSAGFFNAVEIRVIMSLLSIVDNQRQDIPLYAVLRSPIGKLDENDFAEIVSNFKDKDETKLCLADKCELYMAENEDEISNKLKAFFDILWELKADKKHLSISELIWKALSVTNYYVYAMAMPCGDRRKANIDMLLEKADAFENGYYKGLFNFIRFIEKLKVNDVDFGEASTVSEEENVVRIISMHKSKGLEYPVVFVSGLGKQFNEMEQKQALTIHSDYGITTKYYNEDKRYKMDTTLDKCIKTLITEENRAEELRVLYVAMTRAKEKLIITGSVKDLSKIREKYNTISEHEEVLLPYSMRSSMNSFSKHIIASMVRYDRLAKKYKADCISFYEYNIEDIIVQTAGNIAKKEDELKAFVKYAMNIDEEQPEEYNDMKQKMSYEYEYNMSTTIPSKMSISDIKKKKAYDGEGYNQHTFALGDANKEELTGAERGTIVHRFMELLDFSKFDEISDEKFIRGEIENSKNYFMEKGYFDEREIVAVNLDKVYKMVVSNLGKRMAFASKNNMLYKEQQFQAGISPEDYDEKYKGIDDLIIIQGIVDAYFYENDYVILIDYKTDAADEDELILRYKAQLDYYAEIIERLTEKKVKEKIIYSFTNDKEVYLP